MNEKETKPDPKQETLQTVVAPEKKEETAALSSSATVKEKEREVPPKMLQPKMTPTRIIVTMGRTIPGPSQYTSERIDYTVEVDLDPPRYAVIGHPLPDMMAFLEEARKQLTERMATWLPKLPDPPKQPEAPKPASTATPAATTAFLDQTLPFADAVKQRVIADLVGTDVAEKIQFELDRQGNVLIEPTAFLGSERFKSIVNIVNAFKNKDFKTDYVGEGQKKHWIIFNPKPTNGQTASSTQGQPTGASTPPGTLDPEELNKLPWKAYHGSDASKAGWIFVNAPGAESLYTMLKQQRDEQHIEEVPVLMGATMYDCKIGKDKEKITEDKFISRTIQKK